MAGTLKTHTTLTSAGVWSKVMGQGVRGLTATDEYTATVQVQNRGGTKATVMIALVDGNSEPSDDDAGVMRPIELASNTIQPVTGIVCEAGYTIWVKTSQIANVWAYCVFNSTS